MKQKSRFVKRLPGIMSCLVMVFGLMSWFAIEVRADESYGFSVGNVTVNDTNCNDIQCSQTEGTAKYDPDTRTLTLDGFKKNTYNGNLISINNDSAIEKICLKGTSELTENDGNFIGCPISSQKSITIYSEDGSGTLILKILKSEKTCLTLSGTAILTIDNCIINTQGGYHGIAVNNDCILTGKSKVTCSGARKYGVYITDPKKQLKIEEGSTLNLAGGDIAVFGKCHVESGEMIAFGDGDNAKAFYKEYTLTFGEGLNAYGSNDHVAVPGVDSPVEFNQNNKPTTEYKYITVKSIPKAKVVTPPQAKENLVENGNEYELITGGTADGNGIMQYGISNSVDEEPAVWSEAIPKQSKAGTYYVWYKAVGDGNYADSDADYVTVKILDRVKEEEEYKDRPKLKEISSTSIIIETKDGYEYSIDPSGIEWQDDGGFDGLEPGKGYTISIRKKGSGKTLYTIYAKTNDERNNKPTVTEEKFVGRMDSGTNPGFIRVEKRVRDDVPSADIKNVNLEFAREVMDESERKEVGDHGIDCLIYLEVFGKDEGEEHGSIDDKVREKVPGAEFGTLFDISLWKRLGDTDPKKVIKRFGDKKLEITLGVPKELQSENRMFYIGCQHENDEDGDGEPDTEYIETENKGIDTLEFSINRCSDYALYYKDLPSEKNGLENDTGYVAKQRVDAKKLMNLPEGVKIKYIISNKKLARVNRKGVIRIKNRAGTVTITAINKMTEKTISSCTLVIQKPVIKQKKLVVTGVDSGKTSSWKIHNANELLGDTTIIPKWYSSNPAVAAVDEKTGEVKVRGIGRAKIYAVFGANSIKSKFGTRKVYKYRIVSKK